MKSAARLEKPEERLCRPCWRKLKLISCPARVPLGTGLTESEMLEEVGQYIKFLEANANSIAEEIRG